MQGPEVVGYNLKMELFGSWRLAWTAAALLGLTGCGLRLGAGIPEAKVVFGPRGLAVPPGRAAAVWARVQNPENQTAQVTLHLDLPPGATLISGRREVRLRLPGGGSQRVRWAIRFQRPGPARLRLKGTGGEQTITVSVVEKLRTPKRFLLTAFTPPYAWREPPYRDELLADYVNTGFRQLLWVRDEAPLIEKAHSHGLRFYLDVASLIGEDPYLRGESGAIAPPVPAERLKALEKSIARHRDDPLLEGYYLVDEPYPGAFENLAEVVERIHIQDPNRPTFADVFPYFAPDEGSPEYLENFLKAVGVDLLCTDRYFYFNDRTEEKAFLEELALMRTYSQRFGVPFCTILQAIGTNGTSHEELDWRTPTLGELRWEAMASLAYGAKAIVWFHWDTDWGIVGNPEGPAIRDRLKTLNPEIRAFGEVLLPLESLYAGSTEDAGAPIHANNGAFLLGEFASLDQPERYALLVSPDRRKEVQSTLVLPGQTKELAIFDPASGGWKPLESRYEDGETRFLARFAPGGGLLIRYKKP